MSKFHNLALTLAMESEEAAPFLAAADSARKNMALLTLAGLLEKSAARILAANRQDLAAAKKIGLSAAMRERLALNKDRITAMADGARKVATLPDPVGRILDGGVLPNGIRISRVRVPLGVILMIYESRPNVTVDAACLSLKSGNACILRGGREAVRSNRELGRLIALALKSAGLPEQSAQTVTIPDRELVTALLALDRHIDLVVPRGGKGLVETVMQGSRIPVLKHLEGVCHTYVDATADPGMAERIVLNGKLNRPSTCNATETLLAHRKVAAFLPGCLAALAAAGVEIRADEETEKIAKKAGIQTIPATEEDWRTEYNDLILSVKIVPDIDSAIHHVNSYGSGHTDAIVTRSLAAAERFKRDVDSSSVMVNVSTRLADGAEYGLGAEIGISTNKLHARGPVGLEGLTTYKWIVEGEGQIRE